MNHHTPLQDAELERVARKRAAARLGWYIHATVFIAVNLMLAALSVMNGRNWAVFPAFGWRVVLAIHGAVVFLVTGGGGLHDKLVQQERSRLVAQRDAL